MTPDLPAELAELLAKVGGGDWTIVPYGDGDSLVIHSDELNRVCFMATPGSEPGAMGRIEAQAELIVSMKRALPELLTTLTDLRNRLAEAEGERDAARASADHWLGDSQRNLKAGQEAAYALEGVEAAALAATRLAARYEAALQRTLSVMDAGSILMESYGLAFLADQLRAALKPSDGAQGADHG